MSAGRRYRQSPPEQVRPVGQTLPQRPQFVLLVFRLTQAPPHIAVPAAHDKVQAPPEQTWPAAHTAPQRPQFAELELRFVQTPPQTTLPAGHDVMQVPLLHF